MQVDTLFWGGNKCNLYDHHADKKKTKQNIPIPENSIMPLCGQSILHISPQAFTVLISITADEFINETLPYILFFSTVSFTKHNYFESHPYDCIRVVNSFILLSSVPLNEYITISPFISWWTFLAIMNKVAMNIHVYVFLNDLGFHFSWT